MIYGKVLIAPMAVYFAIPVTGNIKSITMERRILTMTYYKPAIKQYERSEVITFKDSKGAVHEISDSERTTCENWTRIMGYMRPTTDYNLGKKAEFDERVWFKESKVDLT